MFLSLLNNLQPLSSTTSVDPATLAPATAVVPMVSGGFLLISPSSVFAPFFPIFSFPVDMLETDVVVRRGSSRSASGVCGGGWLRFSAFLRVEWRHSPFSPVFWASEFPPEVRSWPCELLHGNCRGGGLHVWFKASDFRWAVYDHALVSFRQPPLLFHLGFRPSFSPACRFLGGFPPSMLVQRSLLELVHVLSISTSGLNGCVSDAPFRRGRLVSGLGLARRTQAKSHRNLSTIWSGAFSVSLFKVF
ncbi:hypothetical protein F2Q70_00017068 [Brassica cretica]|uniref:Uncharacterized protein n=1 Tax=Brassica cretica TaxID=69181 RepID=A0A3N6QIC8_BRACR|nr:hypothetical protein F2Q70_00017068 [Brassica cretica]KAF2598196.1 hypothetical protein F2Q68_00010017 [Brassica cretica]